jgi:hypothetical protein
VLVESSSSINRDTIPEELTPYEVLEQQQQQQEEQQQQQQQKKKAKGGYVQKRVAQLMQPLPLGKGSSSSSSSAGKPAAADSQSTLTSSSSAGSRVQWGPLGPIVAKGVQLLTTAAHAQAAALHRSSSAEPVSVYESAAFAGSDSFEHQQQQHGVSARSDSMLAAAGSVMLRSSSNYSNAASVGEAAAEVLPAVPVVLPRTSSDNGVVSHRVTQDTPAAAEAAAAAVEGSQAGADDEDQAAAAAAAAAQKRSAMGTSQVGMNDDSHAAASMTSKAAAAADDYAVVDRLEAMAASLRAETAAAAANREPVAAAPAAAAAAAAYGTPREAPPSTTAAGNAVNPKCTSLLFAADVHFFVCTLRMLMLQLAASYSVEVSCLVLHLQIFQSTIIACVTLPAF